MDFEKENNKVYLKNLKIRKLPKRQFFQSILIFCNLFRPPTLFIFGMFDNSASLIISLNN
ncbi:hypothetical protein ATX33_09480 [Oenococcus oeni]|nr:hypothetical protein X283_03160 [Oenococcus oeni IOEB_1491]KGI05148.1 hypothetical protein X462_04680 [Oenococcus oeni S19]OIL71297.1 hypothetical protein ATX33_09480 [Oenococcus oeni]OIM03313.1 hypothetical protein ATX50_09340 [Oenococcus oeni]